ncbi:MAG: ribonuclease HII [Lachnospiraceae bacterium]|nr:ribonuclease HII [Lachnospiraceae bacterium]
MLGIGEIKQEFKEVNYSSEAAIIEFIDKYENDERAGVINIVNSAKKKLDELKKEIERSYNMRSFERKYYDMGYNYICGIDEVGRGPLAGPVVTCAVILPKDETILYLNDSKQVSKKKREELYEIIIDKALAYSIGISSEERIDEINILQATYEAMRMSIDNLKIKPDILLNDAVKIPNVNIHQVPIIKGDTLSASIAAASIVAKVTRDRIMHEYDSIYPEYGFADNVGYGSAKHIEAIKKYGPTPIHRKTFIKNFV